MTSVRLAFLAVIYSWRILMCRTDAAAVAHRHKHAHHKNAGLQLLQHATHFRPMNSRLKIAVLRTARAGVKLLISAKVRIRANSLFKRWRCPTPPVCKGGAQHT